MGEVQSDQVANLQATTQTLNQHGKDGGTLRAAVATKALATGDLDDNDIAHVLGLPSNARLISLKIYNDDLDSHATPTLAANVGVYDADLAVLDEDAIATAITTLQAANTAGVELLFEANNITNVGKMLWELAGASSDPGGLLYVSITNSAAAATAAAGDVTLVAEYTHGKG